MNKPRIAFFGTPDPAVDILEALHTAGLTPELIVTNPDKPQGRNLVLTPSPVKVWAVAHKLPLFQPEKLDEAAIATLKEIPWDLFIVVAYGKIIPQAILDIPKHGSLNVHYSLLPKYRGASPIESQILADDKNPGISIMLLDSKMDHGPLLGTAPVFVPSWPPTTTELRKASNDVAGKLLVELIPKWISKEIEPHEQDHAQATYTKKFTKADGEIILTDDPYQNFLKIQAFNQWPEAYFFVEKKGQKIRVKIKKAQFVDGKLALLRVVPEGKQEMNYSDFVASLTSN
jgi:methionyl-tRNA formyltransferase